MAISMTAVSLPVVLPARVQDQGSPAATPPEDEKSAASSGGPAGSQTSGSTDTAQSQPASATETPQDAPVAPVQGTSAPAATTPSRPSAQSVVVARIEPAVQDGVSDTSSGDISEDEARAMAEAYRGQARQQAIIDAISETPTVMTIGMAREEAATPTVAGNPYAADDAAATNAAPSSGPDRPGMDKSV